MKKSFHEETQVHDDSTRLDKLQSCSENQQTTNSAFSVIVFPGIVNIITSRRICSNVLKNVSD